MEDIVLRLMGYHWQDECASKEHSSYYSEGLVWYLINSDVMKMLLLPFLAPYSVLCSGAPAYIHEHQGYRSNPIEQILT